MVEPTTVWMVILRRGATSERKGLLSLEEDGVFFRDPELGHTWTLKYEHMRSARRVRGSPVLMVRHATDDGEIDTAFYFTQPPPLKPPEPGSQSPSAGVATSSGRPMGAFSSLRRTSRRRHMRENVRYLTTQSGSKKPEIEAWVEEIAARRRG
jgi:hypothetical protein